VHREPPYTSLENAIVAYRCTTASQAFKHPRMTLLVNAHRPDLPVLSSPLAKNISLFRLVETAIEQSPSCTHQEGRYASSRTWSAGCDGRGARNWRVRASRTAKS